MDSIDHRYELLEKLGEGGMGAVFLAHDRLTRQHVALKRVRVAIPAARPAPAWADTHGGDDVTLDVPPIDATEHADSGPLLLALAQEFRTLASLRHPHIISVLDYGFESPTRPFFTMDLLRGARPLSDAATGATPAQRVRLLVQVLQALTYVHRRRVVHRDLKPANVLVVGEGDDACVKVLDFGIACVRDQAHASTLAGTLDYMAPELFAQQAPSEASDLWAVGIMAHEVLLGAHPLAAGDVAAQIAALLAPGPVFSEDVRLAPALSAVLCRALARAPADRYADAESFAHELARAAGLDPPAETASIRESFLQAASFVAREGELSALKHALGEAVAGRGSVWLVGGESGVGKSRLLEELRTFALVQGTRVTRGQAVSAGGAAYQVWQGALRPLCLDSGLEDADAAVLRAAIPDLARLLDRPLPDPPETDPDNAQARFVLAVERLFAQRSETAVVLLEDLHWAEPASLAVLLRLARAAPGQRLLIVASYRHDERPGLPDEVPLARSLPLHRLSPDEMASLSASMLGDAGRRPELVTLLARETEGNAFFLVEAVRALAQEAGALARIGVATVPSRIMAGGIQAVLARRLGRVPAEVRPFLLAAAVLGRELDLPALRCLPGELGDGLEAKLTACAAVAVLEVSEDRWRFAHDKLREGLLMELSAVERAAWHVRVGEALARAYSGDLRANAAALAYHFDEGGDLPRAARHRLTAGEGAMRAGATEEAIAHLERADSLFDRVGATAAERSSALGLLCRAYHSAGRPEDCATVFDRMYRELDLPSPDALGAIPRQLATYGRLRLRARPGAPPDDEAAVWMRETLDTQVAVGEALVFVRPPGHVVATMLGDAVTAERLGDPVRRAGATTALAFLCALTPLTGLSDAALRLARTLLEQHDAPLGSWAYLHMTEAVVRLIRADWEGARASLEIEIALRRRIGDWRQELFALLQSSAVELWRGSPEISTHLARMDELASRVDNAQYTCWVWCFRALLALRAGELDQVRAAVAQADVLLARTRDRVAGLFAGGIAAVAALRESDVREARRRADATLAVLLATPTLGYGQLEGLDNLAEAFTALWSRCEPGDERDELHRQLSRVLAAQRTFSAMFPLGRPRGWLWTGRSLALHGQAAVARWCFERALATARSYRMPFDEALARDALARCAAARGEHERATRERAAARAIFARLGARWHVAAADPR